MGVKRGLMGAEPVDMGAEVGDLAYTRFIS
jgi:hypothetical protein